MTNLPFRPGSLYEGFLGKLKKRGLAKTNDFYVKIDINENLAKLPFEVPQRFTSQDKREISFMCKGVELPKLGVSTQDFVGKPSVVSKIAHKREETQILPISFYCSTDLWERRFFEKWIDFVVDPKTYTPNYYDEYAKYNTITVFSLPKSFSGNFVFEGQVDFRSLSDMQSVFNGSPLGGGSFNNDPSSPSLFSNSFSSLDEFSRSQSNRGIGSGQQLYYVKFFECYPISISAVQLSTANTDMMEFSVEMSYKYFQSISDVEFSPLKKDVL